MLLKKGTKDCIKKIPGLMPESENLTTCHIRLKEPQKKDLPKALANQPRFNS